MSDRHVRLCVRHRVELREEGIELICPVGPHPSNEEWAVYDTVKRKVLNVVNAKKEKVTETPDLGRIEMPKTRTEPRPTRGDKEPKIKKLATAKFEDNRRMVLWIRFVRVRLSSTYVYRVQWEHFARGTKGRQMGTLAALADQETARQQYEKAKERAMKRGWKPRAARDRTVTITDFPSPSEA